MKLYTIYAENVKFWRKESDETDHISIISRDCSGGEPEYSSANFTLSCTLHENGRNLVLTPSHGCKNFSL